MGLRRTALPLATATVILAAMFVSLSSSATGAATASSRVLASSAPTNGVWPGVGKICEAGPGGASSVRGVGGQDHQHRSVQRCRQHDRAGP